ncbi:MAG: hypothetical protein HQK59_03625 [Deltaproteobacteria bacterium]|nr:hypothetical protein [Deltaproteobacteria bacterium]
MKHNELEKYTISFGLSLAITSLFSALLVILKELCEHSVLVWMGKATGHHWMTHGIIDVVVFVALGWLLGTLNGGRGVSISAEKFIKTVVGAVVISGLIIVGFYTVDMMAG